MTLKLKSYPEVSRQRIGATRQITAIQATIAKLEKEWSLLGPEEIQALKVAMDARFKLLAKCLPDLKAIEHSGELQVDATIKVSVS